VRAVDRDGFVLDVLAQGRRDGKAARRRVRNVLKKTVRDDHRHAALLRRAESLFGNSGLGSRLFEDVIQAWDVEARAPQPHGEACEDDEAISVRSDG
jgi:hypothetical protein